MAAEALEQLVDRWTSDAAFADGFRVDREGATPSAGYDLNDKDRRAVRGAGFELSDWTLAERTNKPGIGRP